MLSSHPRILVVLPLLAIFSLAAAAAPEPSHSVRWQDPAEGAFSASLPSGWQISGGTVRTTRIEPHFVIRAKSPDGGIEMFMDDPRIVTREIPNIMTQRLGMREGSAVPAAWGGKMLIERYESAPATAARYVQQVLCPSASMMRGGIIPGQTQSLNQQMSSIARAEGKTVHVDVGEISFKCGERDGYVYAVTLQAWQPGGPVSLWVIYRIAGFLTTPQDSAAAAAAIHAMLGSFQMNQAWLQRFSQEAGDVAGNVIRESNAVTQSTIERAKQEDATMAAQNAAWKRNSDATFNAISKTTQAVTGSSSAGSGASSGDGHNYNAQLGTKTVCDDLDRCQTVDAAVDTWYSDCSGTFYPGTSSGGAPPSSTSACWSKGH
jgi:hypothetical protein